VCVDFGAGGHFKVFGEESKLRVGELFSLLIEFFVFFVKEVFVDDSFFGALVLFFVEIDFPGAGLLGKAHAEPFFPAFEGGEDVFICCFESFKSSVDFCNACLCRFFLKDELGNYFSNVVLFMFYFLVFFFEVVKDAFRA